MFDRTFDEGSSFVLAAVLKPPSLKPLGVGAHAGGVMESFSIASGPGSTIPLVQWGSMPMLVRDLAS